MALKAVIHVNQHVIKANRKNGTDYPVLTVKTYKETRYTNKVTINGPGRSQAIAQQDNEIVIDTRNAGKWIR